MDYENDTGAPVQNLAHVIDNPFEHRSVEYKWQSGDSVLDILNSIDSDLSKYSIVCVNGHKLAREYYHVTRPKQGTLLTVNVMAHDRDIFRTIAFIGLAVGAALTGQYYAGLYFGGNAFVQAAIGAGIFAVGSLAINALLPLQQATFDVEGITRSQSLAIGAARNRVAPFSPLPVLLGRMKMYPNMAALPYTSRRDPATATMLLYLGTGDICVEKDTAKLGETLLSTFSGVTVQYDTGCADDAIDVYKKTVYEESVGVAIRNRAENKIIRTTQAATDKAIIDIHWLRGAIEYMDDGEDQSIMVGITIRYREEGASTWIVAWDFETWGWSNDVLRVSKAITFPTPGKYQISVHSATGLLNYSPIYYQEDNTLYDGDETPWGSVAFNTPTWTVLRSVQKSAPVNKIPQSCAGESPKKGGMIGLEIVATEQLSGTPDIFNVVGQSKAKDWTGSGWVEASSSGTSNPASLLRYLVLTNCRATARPLTLSRLNNVSFQEFWTWCDDMGFEFNMYVDFQSTVQEMINMVAAAGRALCYPVDGEWIVKIDKKQTAAHQYLSPRNTKSFNVSRVYPDELHAFRCRFISEEENWQNSEIIIYKDTYTSSNATQFEALELPGVTNPDQIWLLGRYWLNVSVIQRETFTIVLDIENLVSLPGDRIEWSEESLLVGLGAARVLTFGDPTMVLDADLAYAGGSYGFTIRHSDGTATTVTAVPSGASPTATWTVAGSPSVVAGDLAIFGEVGEITQALIIKDIVPGDDLTATLTCLPYDDALYPEENLDVPPTYVPVITEPPAQVTPVLETPESTPDGLGTAVTITPYVPVEGQEVDLSEVAFLKVEWRETTFDENGDPLTDDNVTPYASALLLPETESYTIDTVPGVWYDIKVSYVYTSGLLSASDSTTFLAGAANTIYGNIQRMTLTTGTAWVLPMGTQTAALELETYKATITLV